MSWRIEYGETPDIIEFNVEGGTGIETPVEREVATSVSLAGKRFVHRGPIQPPAPKHPPIVFQDTGEKDAFLAVVNSGITLSLFNDLEEEYKVVAAEVKPFLKDTPRRDSQPYWTVEVVWVGVA